ncbi:protein Wnt-5b-like [Planococcus citri]|uniref:protein Wnt-5b-like n=1 Tax=Planococcus citri TaxID=170843 RepID=UPI0031F8C88C
MKMKILWLIILIVFSPLSTSKTTEIFHQINVSAVSTTSIATISTTNTILEKSTSPTTPSSDVSIVCNKLKGLSSGQLKHCHLYEDHMDFVNKSIRNSLKECQWQFRYQKWNCSIISQKPTFFGPVLKFGNKEAAFLQAVTTASVMHGIARTCRDGQLTRCGCSTLTRPADLSKEWIWKGCGDNLEYGYKFTRNFIDIKEKEIMHRRKAEGKENGKSLMMLHNYEAGRRAVLKMTRISCKCHGVSGSCTLITCWHQLPQFREIGDYIKKKYDEAIRVKVNKKGRLQIKDSSSRKPTVTDLLYIHQSPNYCKKNISFDSLGTENRECNKNSKMQESCDALCCGRGYSIKKVILKEKCNCTFHWCCYVKCDSCEQVKEIYTCN